MIAGLLTLAAVWVLFGALWLIAWPWLRSERPAPDADAARLRDLKIEKARLLAEIHELELDWETGKLSEADYRAIEGRLKGRAVEVMREIDAGEGEALEARSRRSRRRRAEPAERPRKARTG